MSNDNNIIRTIFDQRARKPLTEQQRILIAKDFYFSKLDTKAISEKHLVHEITVNKIASNYSKIELLESKEKNIPEPTIKEKIIIEKLSQLNHLLKIRISDLGKIRKLLQSNDIPFELVDCKITLIQEYQSSINN